MNNPEVKYCQVHKDTEMRRKFNSTIFECPICKMAQNKELLKRAFKKKSDKQESITKIPKTSSKGSFNKKTRKITSSKSINKKLDDAWSLLVKLRAGHQCEYCKTTKTLNSHHIFSRSNQSVRWDTMNGICLCVKHHTFDTHFSAHKASAVFILWLTETKGTVFMQNLRLRANNESHYTLSEKQLILDTLLKEIEQLKAA